MARLSLILCLSIRSFFNPEYTQDGQPFGPLRFRQICREEYIISATTHTSFLDVEQISPRERELIIEFLKEDKAERDKKRQEELEQMNNRKRK